MEVSGQAGLPDGKSEIRVKQNGIIMDIMANQYQKLKDNSNGRCDESQWLSRQ
jgi:hypothetical protein